MRKLRLQGAASAGYEQVLAGLRSSYDAEAQARDRMAPQDWKLDERAAFLDRLRAAGARTLLEVGAGTGRDSAFFAGEGLEVTAVDVSPEMVRLTRAKGVTAYERDVLALGFAAESFDAGYAFNSLLHVPNKEFPAALRAIRTVLRPGGLFFLGVYGGDEEEEGVAVADTAVPPRFFSFRSDRQLLELAAEHFEILDFHVNRRGDRFQALTLVRP